MRSCKMLKGRRPNIRVRDQEKALKIAHYFGA
jgi:hypothetical protein